MVEPLFSAFGEDALHSRMEDSAAVAIITQRKHLGKVRRVRERIPSLKTSSSSTTRRTAGRCATAKWRSR